MLGDLADGRNMKGSPPSMPPRPPDGTPTAPDGQESVTPYVQPGNTWTFGLRHQKVCFGPLWNVRQLVVYGRLQSGCHTSILAIIGAGLSRR